MLTYPLYTAGEFIKSSKELLVSNPYNGEAFAVTYLADNSILEKAIAKAQSIAHEYTAFPAYKRYAALMHISRKLTEKREEIGKILAQEAAKPLKYALAEIDRSAQTFLVAAEEAKRSPREYMGLDWTPAGEKREGIIKYFPIGLVAGIAPFNFPLNLAVHKIAPAIASGCPIILKPASSTPLASLELAKIIDETELPKGAVSILPMDRSTGNQLVTDERFKLLSFTGSPEIGWEMKKQAGKKKVVLELGGNAGVIVCKSADREKALKQTLMGAFAYSGQVCIHAQRIFVEDEIFDEFAAEFIQRTEALKSGDPLDPSTDISSMIDEKNALRIESWVNEAVSSGAKVLTGGKRSGTYYAPTVLTNTTIDMKVCALEAFGPIVTLEKFSGIESAIKQVNTSVFGLQAGVFTKNTDDMWQAFNTLDVGGVVINDVPTFRVDHMPYGGVKESGLGREGVKYAMLDMLEPKILVVESML